MTRLKTTKTAAAEAVSEAVREQYGEIIQMRQKAVLCTRLDSLYEDWDSSGSNYMVLWQRKSALNYG